MYPYAWHLLDKISEISKAKRINNEKLHDDSKTNYVNFLHVKAVVQFLFPRKMYLSFLDGCDRVYLRTQISHATHDMNVFQLSSDNFYLWINPFHLCTASHAHRIFRANAFLSFYSFYLFMVVGVHVGKRWVYSVNNTNRYHCGKRTESHTAAMQNV